MNLTPNSLYTVSGLLSQPVDSNKVHTAAGVGDSHSAGQDAIGGDSSGSGKREDTVNIHTDINDSYGAAQDILGYDSSQPVVERKDIGSSVSNNFSLVYSDLSGCNSSGPMDREECNSNCSNDSHTEDQDALRHALSKPDERHSNSVDVHSSYSAQGAQGSSGPENGEDSNYIHTDINDAYGAAQDILGCDPSQPAVEGEDNSSSVSVDSNNSLLSADSDLSGNGPSGPVDIERKVTL